MSWRNHDIPLLLGTLVLFAVAYAMKVPALSGFDLALVTAAGLVAIDLRLRGL